MITTNTIIGIIAYLILAPVVGCLLAGVDRKVTARMQGRFGPPILQPYYDFCKLLEKEPITVNKAQDFNVMCFLVFIILTGCFFFGGGDLLLFIFTLTLGSVFLVAAAYSSNSPYAQAGAQRELLQIMAYEPMVLLTAIGFYVVYGSFNVRDIVTADTMAIQFMPVIFIGYIFILTIKLRKSPFDLSMSHHAHQELVAGLKTEFSGKTLAMLEIGHWYENVFLLALVYLFFAHSAPWSIVLGIVVCLLVYFLEVLIDNSFARMKWQFALKSAWIAALVGVVNLAVIFIIIF